MNQNFSNNACTHNTCVVRVKSKKKEEEKTKIQRRCKSEGNNKKIVVGGCGNVIAVTRKIQRTRQAKRTVARKKRPGRSAQTKHTGNVTFIQTVLIEVV